MNRIFVDTWLWYALSDERDNNHELAVIAVEDQFEAGNTFVTTNFVFDESITSIRYRVHYSAAINFLQMFRQLVDSQLVEFIRVSETHEQEGLAIFEQYTDQDFSYTDCTSFAVMRAMGLTHAFTADNHFATMGFILIP